MVPNQTRRRLLQTGSVLATTALAGCSSLLGSDENDDPDAGTDSYGILLMNEMSQTHTVSIEAVPLGGGDPVFEETVEIESDEEREWEQVLTGDSKQFRVNADLENANFFTNWNQNRATVSVGTDVSPEVENIIVKIAPYYDSRTVWVNKTKEEP